MNDYYVYAYFNEGAPYYIGKGRGNRAYNKHRVPRPQTRDDIVIISENLPNVKALEIEHYLIKYFGRVAEGGLLLNVKGGGGVNGTEGRKQTDEHKRKRSEAQKGKKRAPMSQAHKDAISKGRLGLKLKSKRKMPKLTEEHKAKISAGLRGNTNRRLAVQL